MNPLRSLSDTFRRRSRRERLVLLGGAAISIVALGVTFVVLPFLDHWRERETATRARAEQLARLESLASQRGDIERAVSALRELRDRSRGRLLEGSTAAVAASTLQLLLQRYADESRVLVQRVDVAGAGEAAAAGLVSVPARLYAQGDIYGLVDLLFYLQQGETLLVVDDIRITAGAGPGLLSVSIALHGYYAAPEVAG